MVLLVLWCLSYNFFSVLINHISHFYSHWQSFRWWHSHWRIILVIASFPIDGHPKDDFCCLWLTEAAVRLSFKFEYFLVWSFQIPFLKWRTLLCLIACHEFLPAWRSFQLSDYYAIFIAIFFDFICILGLGIHLFYLWSNISFVSCNKLKLVKL